MKLPRPIYIDTAFVVEFYERVKKTSVPTRVVKKSNVSGGISAGIFGAGFNTGATMEEEKEFPIPARKMYDEILPKLEKLPEIKFEKANDSELPELFWVSGIFGMIQSSISDKSIDHYVFQISLKNKKRIMFLVLNDVYFESGYDQLSRHGYALTAGFGIHAKLLVRLLYLDRYFPVAAPMVVIKSANFETSELRQAY
jgi:hypothetical protein